MFRNWCKDEKGNIATVSALLLPVVVVYMAVVVDAGLLMAKKTHLQALAELAAQAGAVEIGNLVVQKAQAHNPPPEATDPLPYLTDEDRAAITADPQVPSIVQDYLDYNNAANLPLNLTISYPDNAMNCNGSAAQKRFDLRVTAQETVTTLFPYYYGGKSGSQISAQAIMSVPVCP